MPQESKRMLASFRYYGDGNAGISSREKEGARSALLQPSICLRFSALNDAQLVALFPRQETLKRLVGTDRLFCGKYFSLKEADASFGMESGSSMATSLLVQLRRLFLP